MLAHKKSKSLSSTPTQTQSQSGNNKDPVASTFTPIPKTISPSNSSGNLIRVPTPKNNNGKRPSFTPLSKGQGQEGPERTEGLDTLLPGLKDNLFSSEINNVQRGKEMKKLLHYLTDWGSISDKNVLKLIQSLKQNVDSLDDKMIPLVSQVLDANWCSRSSKVVSAFEDFISELVVVRSSYGGGVLQSLIKKFLPQGSGDSQNPDVVQEQDQRVFDVVHRSLKRLLEAFPIPRMRESCVKTMGSMYPYMGKPAYIHYCYVKNLIQATTYVPQISLQILHLIVHKLCRIDVNVPRRHSEDLEDILKDSELSEQVKMENGQIMSITLDSKQVINSIIYQFSDQINPLVNVLDLCLTFVFEFVENFLAVNSESEEAINCFYDSFLSTFESDILPTFGLNHVQFLYFYLVSTQSKFAKKFLDFLWKKVINVNTPAVIRMQCMSYISGVLARSKVISVKVLKRWLTSMADWANAYVDQKVKTSHWSCVNVQMHGPFYAVCQAIFYVFAFRNKDLVGSKKCTAFTGTLNLGRLVTCDLNPLKAISPDVAVAFVKAAHVHQISYCQTVLERNQRATIPTTVRDSLSVTDLDSIGPVFNILEAFFPFDPYMLPRSRKWIDPIYRLYEPYLPEVKIEKSDSSSPSRPSDDNDDSIDMELSTSFQDRDRSHFMVRLMSSSDIKYDDVMDYDMST